MGSLVLPDMFTTLASVKPRLRLTPLSSTLPTTASHLAPALVLTRSPRDLTPPLRDLLLTMAMAMLVTTMASVRLRLTLLSSMLDTHTPLSMVLSPTLLPPPLLDSSTLPILVSAPTIWGLLFLARQLHPLSSACNQHQVCKVMKVLPNIGTNKD